MNTFPDFSGLRTTYDRPVGISVYSIVSLSPLDALDSLRSPLLAFNSGGSSWLALYLFQ